MKTAIIFVSALMLLPVSVVAQSTGPEEIVVTGDRIPSSPFGDVPTQVGYDIAAADQVANVECGSGGTSGVLESIIAQGLPEVNIAEGGGGGTSGGAGGGLISCVTSQGCPGGAGNIDLSQLQGLLGDLNPQQIIQVLMRIPEIRNLGNQAIQQILGLFGGGGGSVQDISQALQNATNLGGSLNGGLLGVTSGITGGPANAVPVIANETDTRLDKIHTVETSVDKHIGVIENKECVKDPLQRKLSTDAANQIHADAAEEINTGREGESFFVKNQAVLENEAQHAAAKDAIEKIKNADICVESKGGVERWLSDEEAMRYADAQQKTGVATSNAADTSAQAGGNQCTNTASESPWDRFNRVITKDNTTFAYISQKQEVLRAQQAAVKAVSDAQTSDHYLPDVDCIDPKTGAKTPGKIEDCPNSYEVKTPAATYEVQAAEVTTAGTRQLEDSHEIKETVDPKMQQLLNQIFAFGFSFLSQQVSGGGGSYLDQISGNSENGSVGAARDYLAATLDEAATLEGEYQSILTEMLGNLGTTRTAFMAVKACYLPLSKTGGTGLSTADAALKMNQASTTVDVIIDPQMRSRTVELNDSRAVVAELGRLKTQAQGATTAEEVNAVSDAYSALQSAGLVHSPVDISFLREDAAASAEALAAATAGAAAALLECQSYTP